MSAVETTSIIQLVGAAGFGSIIGWYVYYINRHRTEKVKMSDLVTLIGIIGGGAILALFPASTDLFGAYGVGLAIGFFGYFGLLNVYVRKSKAFETDWFLDGRSKKPTTDQQVGPAPMKDPNSDENRE
jgi:hypothetical protein